MRVAVLSDIHGNLRALEAVLHALEARPPDEIWCLGDLVGYGARPNECCELVRLQTQLCLAGNHDLGVLGALDLAEFSPDASAAAHWTRRVLGEEARNQLLGLRPSGGRASAQLFHGSPRDPVWEYILTGDAMAAALEMTVAPVILVGHSHIPFVYAAGTLAHGPDLAGRDVDLATGRHLLNPGSVGQPRDGDPRASFLELDLGVGLGSFRRVAYDVEGTQRDIRDAGLPEGLAQRLAGGY